jgi:hypothetical protein
MCSNIAHEGCGEAELRAGCEVREAREGAWLLLPLSSPRRVPSLLKGALWATGTPD